MQKASIAVTVAVIGAIASIAAAMISSNFFSKFGVREQIRELEIIQLNGFEAKASNTEYTAHRSGIVIALATASPEHRWVSAAGYIGSEVIAATTAQDSTVPGVPSVSTTSFTMPVPGGKVWRVEVPPKDAGQVQVRWFDALVPPSS